MNFGHFDDSAKEYVITTPNTPLPWINYLGTQDFFTLISNTCGGYSFYKDAKLLRITRYRYNSLPLDSNGKYYYINDNGTIWNPVTMPSQTPVDTYECRHGLGYSRFCSSKNGLSADLLAFVPVDATCEINYLKLKNRKQELVFAGAGLFGIVLYFMLENTALTMTYASNVGIIVACAPFFVAVTVGLFFRDEKPGRNFFIGFAIAISGIILISLNGQKGLNLNPVGDGLAFLAMISWGGYSALVRKIGEWGYPVIAVTRRIYFYGILFLIPVLLGQDIRWKPELFQNREIILNFLFLGFGASAAGFLLWNLSTAWIGAVKTSVYIYVSPVVTVILSVLILHEKITAVSVIGSLLIFAGLVISQKNFSRRKCWRQDSDNKKILPGHE